MQKKQIGRDILLQICWTYKKYKYKTLLYKMSNVRILSNNGQINGSSSTFGNTIKDGSGTILQTTYLPKQNDNLQVYRYVSSNSSTRLTTAGNVASLTLPTGGVGLSAGRFGQLNMRMTILVVDGSGGTPLLTPVMDQYLLSTGIDGSGNAIQPPYFSQLLGSTITEYIPTLYSTTTTSGTSPGFSLENSNGILKLTIASSDLQNPGLTFNVILDIDIISSGT